MAPRIAEDSQKSRIQRIGPAVSHTPQAFHILKRPYKKPLRPNSNLSNPNLFQNFPNSFLTPLCTLLAKRFGASVPSCSASRSGVVGLSCWRRSKFLCRVRRGNRFLLRGIQMRPVYHSSSPGKRKQAEALRPSHSPLPPLPLHVPHNWSTFSPPETFHNNISSSASLRWSTDDRSEKHGRARGAPRRRGGRG